MKSFSVRYIAVYLAIGVSLAACSGGSGSLRMTPTAQSMQSEAQIKNGALCKTLPLINAKAPKLDTEARRHVTDSNCSIWVSHGMGSHSHAGALQVFDVPGAIDPSNCAPSELFDDCGTAGNAINAAGTVVGYYLNANDVIASFVRTARSKYTTFQAQMNEATIAYDVTDGGTSVGQYFDAHGVSHAFIRNKGGSFVRFEAPWASQNPDASVSQGTSAGMVNAEGESAGIYFDAQGIPHGFIRHRNGSFIQIVPDGSLTSTVCIVCLNDRGTSAGNYTTSDGITRGYVRSAAGKITTVAPPGAVATIFGGLNNRNWLTGFYVDQNSVVRGLIVSATKKQIVFQDPDASQTYGNGTQPEAINDAGEITGLYSDDQGVVHGFYRSAAGDFSEFDPPGSVFTEPFSINSGGTVTGYWYDAQGAAHGFIWKPHKGSRSGVSQP
jgi:hypothetical protein